MPSFTHAAQSLPLNKGSYGDVIAPEGTTAIDKIKDLVGIGEGGGGIIGVAKLIIGAFAVLMIIASAVQILTAGGNEETIKKHTKQLMYAIAGLALVSLSGDMIKIFGVETGGPLKNPSEMIGRVVEFNKITKIVIVFFKYLIGGIAVFQVIASGLHLITLEDESKLDEDKKKLLYGIVGFVLIIFSETLVQKVFYKIDISKYAGTSGVQTGMDPARGLAEIVSATNYVVSFVGPLAVLALIVGAIMYITAGGEEEKMNKAKRVIIAAAIGIIIIYGAFAIVSTVISRKFTG
ncbi:hypothetical protein HZA39_03160 [Candidatus Peregrinibacteria bacterium]|nr:hypothetical protein [Candidatus Peregrinibacteria bacterium]